MSNTSWPPGIASARPEGSAGSKPRRPALGDPRTLGASGSLATMSAGLEGGLVPVPAWLIIALGAFIVIAVFAYLAVQLAVRRRSSR